jgi:hypothetical protein
MLPGGEGHQSVVHRASSDAQAAHRNVDLSGRRAAPRRRRREPRIKQARSALGLGPVSAAWIRDLRGLPATLDRLRIDRQLEEALACGADPLRVAAVFGIDTSTAIRYATNARQLLAHHHQARLLASPSATNPASPPSQAPERQPR